MAEDEYALPKTDPCYRDFEAIKRYLTPRIEAIEHYNSDHLFAPLLEKSQACCPELARQIQDLRPARPDEKPSEHFTLPRDMLQNDAACAKLVSAMDMSKASPTLVDAWVEYQARELAEVWHKKYLDLAMELQGCCMQKIGALQAKLLAAPVPSSAWVKRSGCDQEITESAKQCQDKWNDYFQAARTGWKTALEEAGERQRKLDADFQAADTRLQLLKTSLSSAQAESERLQTALTEAAPRPGSELFAAFPAGKASDGLALLGEFALAAGFLLGLPGRHAWWAKLAFGTVVALISLGIYLGIVYLLPDTRETDLLLAVAGALLFASLQALLHQHLSPVRRQGQTLNRFSQWRPPQERQAAPAIPEPGRRTRW